MLRDQRTTYATACRCQSTGEIIMICTVQARRLLVLMAVAAATASLFPPETVRAAESMAPMQDSIPAHSPTDSRKEVDTVTVEGRREVKRQIDAFVYGILVTYTNE